MKKTLRMIFLFALITLVIAGYFKLINSKEVVWVFSEVRFNQASNVLVTSSFFGMGVLIFLKIMWKLIGFNWGENEEKEKIFKKTGAN